MKKTVIVILVLILLGVGYYIYAQKARQAQAPTTQNAQENATSSTGSSSQSTSTTKSAGQPSKTFSSGSEGETNIDVQVVEVDYNGTSFSPNNVTIKVGDYVFFKNTSTQDFWPASNPHPTHTDYPGFDAKKPYGPGTTYKFQFTKVGTWGYHNHLNPSAGGSVTVTQ